MKPEQLLADDTFLAWYFQTDEACVRKWNQLISEDLNLKASVDEAVSLLQLIHQKEDGQVSHQQIERSRQVLMHRVNNWELDRQPKSVFRISYRHVLQLAACLVLIGFGVFWFWQTNRQQESYSAKGSLTDITLADGTIVTLNKGSEMQVSGMETGEEGNREVWLKGEAFFDVKHQKNNKKFIVHSGDVDVTVLGTRFNVKNGSQRTAVALESGRVELSVAHGKANKLIMKPGELVEYAQASGKLAKSEVNVKNYAAWQEGKVILENADAAALQQVLRDRFDLAVEVEEGAELGEFNGVFPADDPTLLIHALEKAYPGQVVQTEGGLRFVKSNQK